MADPYSIMMSLGTRGDEYDDDLTRRRLDEEEAIRREKRLEGRAIRLEDRNEQREIAREFRQQARDRSSKRQELEDKKKIGQYNALLAEKLSAAERGINFKGKDLFQLKAEIAAYDKSIPLSDYFAIEKQYIDLLPDDNGPISRLKAMTPEEFGKLDRSEALSLQAMVKPLIDSVKIQNQANVVRSSKGYKQFKDKYDRNSQQIAKIIQDVMAPALIKMDANDPGALAAHAATMAVLNNDTRFKDLFPEQGQRDLFGRNPTGLFDQQAGEGYANINSTDSAELMVLYEEARTQALGMLDPSKDLVINNADGTTKEASVEQKKAGLKFLEEEAQMKDKQNRRDNMIKLLPDLIKLQDNMLTNAPDAWKRYLAVDTTTALQELDTTPAATPTPTPQDNRPSLPGQRPALGVDPSRSAYETMVGGQPAPTPPPIQETPSAPVPTPAVQVRGGLPSDERIDIAKKYYERSVWGNPAIEGGTYLGNWAAAGDLPPDELIKRSAVQARARMQSINEQLKLIGASKKGGQISIAPGRTETTTTSVGGEMTLQDRYRAFGADELKANQTKAFQLYEELDTIESDLKKLQNNAERQTKIKIPGLGSGARQ